MTTTDTTVSLDQDRARLLCGMTIALMKDAGEAVLVNDRDQFDGVARLVRAGDLVLIEREAVVSPRTPRRIDAFATHGRPDEPFKLSSAARLYSLEAESNAVPADWRLQLHREPNDGAWIDAVTLVLMTELKRRRPYIAADP
jgi:hypothetical protein